tara:strand:+ start:26483 stop:29002 length:2520 start_codon:yes stop_codon:yes gene_type:complete
MADLTLRINAESQNAVGALDSIGGAVSELGEDFKETGKVGSSSMDQLETSVNEVSSAVNGLQTNQIKEVGIAASSAAGDFKETASSSKDASQALKSFEDSAGETDSIVSALAGGLSELNPELGSAVSKIGEMASVMEAVAKGGSRFAGPLAIITLTVGALALAYSRLKKQVEEADIAQEAAAQRTEKFAEAHRNLKDRVEEVKTALSLMNGSLDEYDIRIKQADLANRQAFSGQIKLAMEDLAEAQKLLTHLKSEDHLRTLKNIPAIEKNNKAIKKAEEAVRKLTGDIENLTEKRNNLTASTTKAIEAQREKIKADEAEAEASRKAAKWAAYKKDIESVLLQLAAQRRAAVEDTLTDQQRIEVALQVEIEALERLEKKYRTNEAVLAEIQNAKLALVERSQRDIANLQTEGNQNSADSAKEAAKAIKEQLSELDKFREKVKNLFPPQTKTRGEELEETIKTITGLMMDATLRGPGSLASIIQEFGPQLQEAKEELEEINRLAAAGNFGFTGLSQEQAAKASGLTDQITNAFLSGGASLLNEIPGLAGQIVKSVFDLGQILMEEDGAEKLAEGFSDTIGAFEAILTEMGPLIEALVPAISESVLNLLRAIPQAIPQAMDGLVAGLESLLDEGFVTQLIEALGAIIPALIRGLIDIFITIYVEIPKVILKHIFGGLKDAALEIGSGIGEFFRGFKEDWKGAFRDLGASIKSFFKDLVGGVVEFFKSLLPDWITSSFKGFTQEAGDLYSPPNSKNRFYVGPEGSFRLSPNDTVMAFSGLKSPSSNAQNEGSNNVIQLVLSADAERLGFGLDPLIQQSIRQRRINTEINPQLILRDPLTASGI